ncbi:MAG TPA: hypothetical protein ENL00_01870, partial [Nitratifractor sp.]|nr:hypothetical protein [Nitratifractor sp.]
MQTYFKYLLLIAIFTANLFACALCRADTPVVTVDTNITAETRATHFSVKWSFHPKFISQMIMYDDNKNGILDKPEQEQIQKALEDYIKQYNYLARVSYTPFDSNKSKDVTIKPNSTKLYLDKKTMYYLFDFDADILLQEGYALEVIFMDMYGNFNFMTRDTILTNFKGRSKISIVLNSSEITLGDPDSVVKNNPEDDTVNGVLVPNEPVTVQDRPKLGTLLSALSQKLTEYKEKLMSLLTDIKENGSVSSYLWLLLFSFGYGLLHAIGPGHGKSLVGSYFLTQNRSVFKAFTMSLLIGVVHTFSAFFLTVFVYFVLNFIFNSFLNDVEYYASKVSAVIIILIALYLIYKKYKASRKVKSKSFSFTAHNPQNSSCGCSSCQTKSEDLGVILAAGIVPCPGTVTIFIFTFGLGIYYIGFLSAIFMSLGMSLIIFITAYLSQNIRKKSNTNTKLLKVLEYGSLLFI